MSFVDKLKFWKKEEEMPEYPKAPDMAPSEPHVPMGMEQMGMPRSMPGLTEPPVETPGQFPASQSFGQQQQFQASMSTDQQLQLISSKLDTIKAQLETVLQRLERLERSTGEERPYQQRWRATI